MSEAAENVAGVYALGMAEEASVAAAGEGKGRASLIRDLAACNKTTRDRALKHVLKTWLPSQKPNQVSDDEMKKIWKGLFYCVWHSDKANVQLDLINRLSSLLLNLSLPLALHYFSVFFLTIRREWPGIDALRLDKFYLLIRRFLHSSFLMLKKHYYWDLETTGRLIGALEQNTFFAEDKFRGNGVNYHIASIFVDELKHFLPVRSETLEVLFKPFLSVMSRSQDKVLLGKVKSNVFDVLLRTGKNLLDVKKLGDEHPSDEVVLLGPIAFALGFSARFYDMGTSPDCFQGNRKVLFSLHEDFLRIEKDLATSGVEISIPDVAEEVPELIPIAMETDGAVSEDAGKPDEAKKVKKNKKAKKAADVRESKAEEVGGDDKKAAKKRKKNKNSKASEQCSAEAEKEDSVIANGVTPSNGTASDDAEVTFSESVISNLRLQFEKVAAEADSFASPEVTMKNAKKRKRALSANGQSSKNIALNGGEIAGDDAGKSVEKSAKKVRFSMKSNLVWKPHSPLPPQNLRIPPSVTPRGSALKKGVSPGPIIEMPPMAKMVNNKKKGRKAKKGISPAIKRLRKLQTLSM